MKSDRPIRHRLGLDLFGGSLKQMNIARRMK